MSKHKKKKEEVTNEEVIKNEEICVEENSYNKECCCENKCDCDEECESEECCCESNNNDSKAIAELNNQITVLKETLLRNQAELQNYKRRKEEETERILKYKNEDLLKELLNVVDNFERAIKMDDNDLSDEVSKFLAGFKLIYGNTVNILNKFDVKEISAEGVEFDANYHHAVLTEHDETKPAGVVLEVLQKGYTYKDRVIRPAMVKVNE